ncbi:MAG: RDD family protein [Bacteroidota bacterium]
MENEILDSELGRQQGPEGEVQMAGFWTRVWAALIDGLVMMPLALLGMYNMLMGKVFLLAVLQSLAYVAYKPLMEWKYGATLGKMAVKIKVVNYDYQPISLDQSYLRFIFYFISTAISVLFTFQLFQQPEFMETDDFMKLATFQAEFESPLQDFSSIASFIVMVSAIFVLFDDRRQALHDKIAKTFCIRVKK